jgi:large subunit ribosomal protein L22
MGKKSAPRVLPDNEAKAYSSAIRTSPQKLNLVAQSIRGLNAAAALAQLTFSKRRVAIDVKKVLQSAIANAENNHQLDVDRLVVAEAFVGKGLVMKRFSPRARGRAGKIIKPFSNLTVIVRERSDAPEQKA